MLSLRYQLKREQFIPCAVTDVFAFFADADNLERITPAFLHFRIETPLPITMEAGALITYRLRLFGMPFRWLTRIELFQQQQRFVDRQIRGPYRLWHHLHEFTVLEGNGIIERRFYTDHPPRAEYVLTKKGQTFGPVLKALRDWGRRHGAEASDAV